MITLLSLFCLHSHFQTLGNHQNNFRTGAFLKGEYGYATLFKIKDRMFHLLK